MHVNDARGSTERVLELYSLSIGSESRVAGAGQKKWGRRGSKPAEMVSDIYVDEGEGG